MSVRIQLRRDTAANWTSTNPTLTQGEPGYETDTGKIKYGDGTTAWNSLAYAPAAAVVDGTIVDADINAAAAISLSKLATGALPTAITVASSNIVDGTIVNEDVNASAAIAGTKISPDFGSQTVTTTGVFSPALGTAAAPSVTFTGDTNTGIYSPGADQVAISTNGTGRLFVDASGRVGIGTTDPAEKLEVRDGNIGLDSAGSAVGDRTTERFYKRTDNGSTNGMAAIGMNGAGTNGFLGEIKFYTSASDVFSASLSERARIDSSGRLLVGTSTNITSALLQVIGTSTVQRAAAVPEFGFWRSSGTTAAPTVVASGDTIGRLYAVGYDGATYINAGRIEVAVDGTPGTNDMPGRLVFSTTADGASTPTERMRIGSTGVVAIGNTITTGGASGCTLRFANPLTGAASPVSILGTPQVQSDVTSTSIVYQSIPSVIDAAFTLANLQHFTVSQGTIGASAVVTNQYGFTVNSSLTGATNNYGFYSNIPSGTGRWNFYANGTADSYFASNNFIFANGGTEKARFDSSGRLLVGASSARATRVASTSITPIVQTLDNGNGGFLVYNNAASANPATIYTAKSRGNDYTSTVQNGDALLRLSAAGADGTQATEAARIEVAVDGTPGADDMPGRIVFATTLDGASSSTERLRITNDGVMCYGQAAPVSYAAATTLVVGDLKNGLIQYTGAAATLTLPTGTLTEGGFAGIYSNMTFEWSVINTGSGTCTIGAGTAHTIVGGATVAAGASGRFASRRTAANTFVSYRLS